MSWRAAVHVPCGAPKLKQHISSMKAGTAVVPLMIKT
jgi:hypothetical protein